jgi:hypothetical protein
MLTAIVSSPGTSWRPALLAALAYFAAAAAMGHRVLANLSTAIVNDVTDSLLTASILTWNATQVPYSDAWWQFPAFAPVADTLTFSEHLLGVSALTTPLIWFTGNPIAAYDLTVLLAYPLSALAMFALVSRLTGSAAAAFLAGLAFGFAPYRAGQLAHVQMLAVWWAPLALLGLHAYLDTGRRRWLACFGACWLLQGAANGYLLVYFTVLVGLWVLWFVIAARRWRALFEIAIASVAFALPLVPILMRYMAAHARHGFVRTPDEVRIYAADIAAPLCASPVLAVWGWLQVGCGTPGEGELFIGVALLVLCTGGLLFANRKSPTVAFYLAAALVTWAFTWGPAPRLLGDVLVEVGPFSALMALPGVDGLRVPARFWMMTVMCLSIAMGVLLAGVPRPGGRAVRVGTTLAAIALLADGWSTIPVVGAPAPATPIESLRGRTVMELPVGDLGRDTAAVFRAVTGGWRVINGYSGYEPAHYAALREASRAEDPGLFAPFQHQDDLDVLVADDAPRLRAMVERYAAARQLGAVPGFTRYRIARTASPHSSLGRRLRAESISASCSPDLVPAMSDDDRRTHWQCGPQTADQSVTVDLGGMFPVGAVVPALGAYPTNAPRELIVELSPDANAWEPVWRGAVTSQAIAAGLADPTRLPLTVMFEPRNARYVRLRQVGRDATWYWSVAELWIIGARSSAIDDR